MTRVRVIKVSLLSVVVSACLLWTCFTCGCRVGESGLLTQANPTTRFKFRPLKGEFEYFDNSGDTLSAKELNATVDGASLTAKDIEIGDRSVENREANVGQMQQANQIVSSIGQTVVSSLSLAGDLITRTRESSEVALERERPSVWRSPWLLPVVLVVALAWIFRNSRLLNPKD